jgi:phosphohistidine phosphatase SixA
MTNRQLLRAVALTLCVLLCVASRASAQVTLNSLIANGKEWMVPPQQALSWKQQVEEHGQSGQFRIAYPASFLRTSLPAGEYRALALEIEPGAAQLLIYQPAETPDAEPKLWFNEKLRAVKNDRPRSMDPLLLYPGDGQRTIEEMQFGGLTVLALAVQATPPATSAAQEGAAASAPAIQALRATVFVVRHAEKATDSNAPETPLSVEGKARAEALARLLADAGVTVIYASNTVRAKDTAAPLAKARGLEVKVESPQPAPLAKVIREHHAHDVVLVVGHSNTVEPLLRELGYAGEEKLSGDYGHVYVLTPGGTDGKPTLVHLRF